MTLVMYHNPQCSTSRQTLALLRQHGVEPHIVEYMKTPPDVETLRAIAKALRLDSPRGMMRTKEAEYTDLGLADEDDPETLLQAMHDHPRLIQRPVLVNGPRARIGRPPEAVLEIAEYDYDRNDPPEPWK
jgi:arsenate reductase